MQTLDDKDKFLDYYMDSIHFMGILQISAIKAMVKHKGQGAEYISCSFSSDDEDYKEGFVTLYFWKPAVNQDMIVYVENQKFYERLLEACEKLMKKEPNLKEELEGYLHQLKIELSV